MTNEDEAKEKRREYERLYREAHRKERAEATQRWRERNPEYTRQYSEANRERIAEVSRQWQKDHPDPEKSRERVRRFQEKNPERMVELRRRWEEANPGKTAEAIRQWARANPEKISEHHRRRRARIAGGGGSHTEQEWQSLKSYYMDQCLDCGDVPDVLTRDHVVPIIQGGTDNIDNIQPLCGPCNSRKHARTIDYR